MDRGIPAQKTFFVRIGGMCITELDVVSVVPQD